MLVEKANTLFLGDFRFLGSVIRVERVGKLSVGYSSGLSLRPLEEMKCLLQTLVDIPTRKSIVLAAFYHEVVNDEMKHLCRALIVWVHNKTNPQQCLNY